MKPISTLSSTNVSLEDQVLAMVHRLLGESDSNVVKREKVPVPAMAATASYPVAEPVVAGEAFQMEDPALAMAAVNAAVPEPKLMMPSPPKEDPTLSLVTAAAVQGDVIQPPSVPQPSSSETVVVEFSAKEQSNVNIITSKQPLPTPKKAATAPKKTLPSASPLARLLAEELGLDLSYIGKGSGKNGKILIDDVRTFQARLEEAKKSISGSGSYFATVSA